MKTLHILLKDKDRNRELLKDVSDDFELRYPEGVSPATTNAFILPDLFVNLSEVVAMWVSKEEE